MTSFEKKWNSLVYPITGHIRWEIEDVLCRSIQFSDNVKAGKVEWRLFAAIEREDDGDKVLTICCQFHRNLPYTRIHRVLRLVKQEDWGKDRVYKKYIFRPRDFPKRMSFQLSDLVSGGFVKDGKLIVECSICFDSEDGVQRREIFFGEGRPNRADLHIFLEKRKLPEKVEKEIEMRILSLNNEISEEFTLFELGFEEDFNLFGMPAKLKVDKVSDSLEIYLDLNSDDESEWWRCFVHAQFVIVNHDDEQSNIFVSIPHLYQGSRTVKSTLVYFWNDLGDLSNGFVEDGKINLKCSFQVLDWYGFDETTNRGIENPMRRMTDVVLKVRWQEFNVAKKVLAQQSTYFRDLFASNPDQSEFKIENVEPEDFGTFLELVHNVDTYIFEENVERVLDVISRFEAPECFERFALVLKRKEFMYPEKVLDWLDKYPLPMMSKRKEHTTNFEKETDLTDLKIEVDGHIYYASRQILSTASHYFMKRFYGPYSEDETDISDLKVSSSNFKLFLTHIYHPARPVTSANLDSLLQLAHQFSVLRLMDKCEEYLVLNDSVSLIDKLEYAGKFNLRFLLEACLKFAKDTEKMSEVKYHPKYFRLPENVRNELTKRESGELQ